MLIVTRIKNLIVTQKLKARTVGLKPTLHMSHVDRLNMGCTRRKSGHCFCAPPPHFRNACAIAGYVSKTYCTSMLLLLQYCGYEAN